MYLRNFPLKRRQPGRHTLRLPILLIITFTATLERTTLITYLWTVSNVDTSHLDRKHHLHLDGRLLHFQMSLATKARFPITSAAAKLNYIAARTNADLPCTTNHRSMRSLFCCLQRLNQLYKDVPLVKEKGANREL